MFSNLCCLFRRLVVPRGADRDSDGPSATVAARDLLALLFLLGERLSSIIGFFPSKTKTEY
jgi:hypothetical protein